MYIDPGDIVPLQETSFATFETHVSSQGRKAESMRARIQQNPRNTYDRSVVSVLPCSGGL